MKKLLALLAVLILLPKGVFAEENAIKTADYFLLSGTTLDDSQTVRDLAKYDLLVLPAEAQVYNPDFPDEIRAQNPDIILLAYMPSVSWNNIWKDSLHRDLKSGIEDSFWLKNSNGDEVSIWPGTQVLDLTSDWRDYLANFVSEEVLADDYWDGVFYDEVGDSIGWIDGVKISDATWTDAYTKLFKTTRELVGDEKIVITNGSSNLSHAPYVNGRMFESFPTPWEGDGQWSTVFSRYLSLESSVGFRPIVVLNSDSNNTGNQDDYQRMRFGLSSSLLGSGYFGFDHGTQSHAQIWRYDEYDAFIGQAKETAKTDTVTGIWERDFSAGKVVVNPTSTSQTVKLGGEYEKLRGTQDKTINDGSIISRVTLQPFDGLVLLRTINEINNGVFLNGAFAKIFDSSGQATRNGFFAYEGSVTGGLQVDKVDLNGDGEFEVVSADGNQVFIYNADGSLHASFYPYTSAYRDGINISVGDLENDGSIEIVTGTENGGGAQVRIFNADGVLINPGFFGYDPAFRGGVNVTIGDLNGDGTNEIICGAGVGGGPHVRVFNKNGKLINPGFMAYDPAFRGGVNVSAADINGDGHDEIITGPGKGGYTQIKAFDQNGTQVITPFYAFDSSEKNGVEVSSADLDGDGIAEIIAFTRDVFTLSSYNQ